MFKRKKKKTGCETPESRTIEIEPVVIATDCGVELTGYANRVYRLNHGDMFVLNNVAIEATFNLSIKDMKLGVINENFICMQKIKRKHWWQFWKPKYWGARFMYVEKENDKCKD